MKTLFDDDFVRAYDGQRVAVDRDIRYAFRQAYPSPSLRYERFGQLRCAASLISESAILHSRDPMSVIDHHVGLLRDAARGSDGQIAFDIDRDLVHQCYILTATWVHRENAV